MPFRSVVFLALLIALPATAQLNKWLVRDLQGVHAMDLTTPTPTVGPLIPGFGTTGEEDLNVMTDAADNVLFSMAVDNVGTIQVRDANYNLMPNGGNLIGHSSTDQSCICPIPCHPDRYFLVHENTLPGSLYYSIVDMTLNGGLGDVTTSNTLITSGVSEGIAISHRMITGCRWLFAAHENGSDFEIVKCLISETGIGPPTTIATINTTTGVAVYEIELMPDNSKLAASVWTTSGADPDIVLWDLDLQTGTLTNQQELGVSSDAILGIQFSPGQNYLYYLGNSNISSMDFGRLELSTLTTQLIDANAGSYLTQVELAGNGRIYFAQNYSSSYIAEVASPDAASVALIGYNHDAIFVSAGGCRPPLPNAIEGEPPGTPPPPGYIEFSGTLVGGCDTYQFTDSTCLGTWWEWDLGDGTISYDQAPIHQYNNGTYDVTLRVVACGDTLVLTKPAYIVANTTGPTAGMSFPDTVCQGTTVTFFNTSVGATSYAWDFGDGGTSFDDAPAYTFNTPGDWTVQLTATSGCASDVDSGPIVVLAGAIADFTIGGDTCALYVALDNTSSPGGPWSWDLGDGGYSTDMEPAHTYGTSGTYTITLIAGTGDCADTLSQVVNVSTSPSADFTYTLGCDQEVTFTDQSMGANALLWTLGDATTESSTNFSHVYLGTGPYTVTLTATALNGCDDAFTVQVAPLATITALFDVGGDTCALSVTVTDQSTGSSTRTWDLGDGTSATTASVSHTYAAPGTYTIRLIASPGDPCADTLSTTVTVDQAPVAGMSFVPGCGQEVSFTNTSTPGVDILWNFDDGNYSVADSVVHTYSSNGTYDVTITAFGAGGCTDEMTVGVVVDPSPSAVFLPTGEVCDSARTFANSSLNANAYAWTFDDGGTSSDAEPTHVYAEPGNYTVMLIADPGSACADTASITITVGVLPVAAFSDSVGCTLDVTLTDASTDASDLYWTLGDGWFSDDPIVQHAYATAGTYTVTLYATSADDCVDSTAQAITILPPVQALFSAAGAPCSRALSFTNASSNSSSYQWWFGDGYGSTVEDPEYTYQLPGEMDVQLIAFNSLGCTDTATVTVVSVAGDIPPGLFIPNTFTPNGDGINDTFMMGGLPECFGAVLDIFNRWGEHIFTTNKALPWDGNVDGQQAPDGVYVYLLHIEGEVFYGTVTLLR